MIRNSTSYSDVTPWHRDLRMLKYSVPDTLLHEAQRHAQLNVLKQLQCLEPKLYSSIG